MNSLLFCFALLVLIDVSGSPYVLRWQITFVWKFCEVKNFYMKNSSIKDLQKKHFLLFWCPYKLDKHKFISLLCLFVCWCGVRVYTNTPKPFPARVGEGKGHHCRGRTPERVVTADLRTEQLHSFVMRVRDPDFHGILSGTRPWSLRWISFG